MNTCDPGAPPLLRTESRSRRFFHASVCLVAWVVFIWAWYLVFFSRTSQQTFRGVIALLVFLLLATATTLLWIRHNLALFRRKTPRRLVPAVVEDWRRDKFGRQLHGNWDDVRQARVIRIDVSEERKAFAVEEEM